MEGEIPPLCLGPSQGGDGEAAGDVSENRKWWVALGHLSVLPPLNGYNNITRIKITILAEKCRIMIVNTRSKSANLYSSATNLLPRLYVASLVVNFYPASFLSN
jgi:hypothetical protein